jgi:hypothetical protein
VYLVSFEKEIRATCENMNDMVCRDSCLEFFLNPQPEKGTNYFNFEMNPFGTLYLGFGKDRYDSKKIIDVSPELFNKTTYKKGMEVEVNHIPLDNIISKLKNSSNETFSGEELANLVRQKNLTYLDVTKGVVIHEIFHSIIHMKSDEEIFSINYDGKLYDCRGVKGELLDEGLVEYYARKFADRHNLFIFPSIPYQSNVEYAKLVEKKIGKNTDKLVFNGNYKTVLNYIHEPNFLESYHILENDWLQTRIVDRLKIAESKNDFYDFGEVEELKLA